MAKSSIAITVSSAVHPLYRDLSSLLLLVSADDFRLPLHLFFLPLLLEWALSVSSVSSIS